VQAYSPPLGHIASILSEARAHRHCPWFELPCAKTGATGLPAPPLGLPLTEAGLWARRCRLWGRAPPRGLRPLVCGGATRVELPYAKLRHRLSSATRFTSSPTRRLGGRLWATGYGPAGAGDGGRVTHQSGRRGRLGGTSQRRCDDRRALEHRCVGADGGWRKKI
jgi:hypothetical protein